MNIENNVFLNITFLTFHLRKLNSLRATEERTVKPHTQPMNQHVLMGGLQSSQPLLQCVVQRRAGRSLAQRVPMRSAVFPKGFVLNIMSSSEECLVCWPGLKSVNCLEDS